MPRDISIPQNWQVATLGDVLKDVIGGGTPSRDVERYWNGDIPWITVKDMRTRRPEAIQEHITEAGVNECATNIIPADTVITATRVGLGKVVRVPYPAAINQDLKALIVGPDLDKDYLEWWIISQANYIESIGSGTTVKGIRLNQLKELEIPLPPLPQQRRIVEAIELQLGRLDAAVARLQGAKARLKRYKQAVLKAAVEGAFLYPDLEQDELPKGWKIASLGELVEDPRYGTSKKCGSDTNGIPVLRIPNIGDGVVSQADLKYASFDAKERKAYELRAGDLLTIRSNGSVDLVGKCALIREVDEHCLYAGYLIRLRPKRDIAEPRYLLYHLSSLPSRVEIESKAKSTSGVNNINAQELKDLSITLPPLKDQIAICDAVEVLMAEMNILETTLDAQLQQAVRLRQAVLKRAFEGRLG